MVPVKTLLTRFGTCTVKVAGSLRSGLYWLTSLIACQVIPAGVGAGVVPMYIIALLIQIIASRSNCRPVTLPVKLRTIMDHGAGHEDGGLMVPVRGVS